MVRGAVAIGLWAILGWGVAGAADWSQWRGPARDGRIAEDQLPRQWPEKLKRLWQVEVGVGHSSPLVVNGGIYLHSRQGDQEVVRRLDPKDGSTVWEDRIATPYTVHSSALAHGKGPKSTPIAHQGRLFTLGISGRVSAFELESGKLLWRHDFAEEFAQTSPLFGVAMSPLVEAGLLIVHVGGHDQGALRALETTSGKLIWEWTEDGPAYASPILYGGGDSPQLVTQTQNHLVSIDFKTGRLLWRQPFSTNYYQNSITPVISDDLLIYSGLDSGLLSLRLKNDAPPEPVWKNTQASLYMSSPVLVDGLLYGHSHKRKGQFFCLDPATGELVWSSRGREGENAAVLASSRYLLFLTTNSELIVNATGRDGYQPLARYSVADTPTWAHPAFYQRSILIKDLNHLIRWSPEP